MTKFDIQYELKGHGWATVRFIAGDSVIDCDASYLSSPLAGMTCGALSLLRHGTSASFVLIEEPATHIVELRAVDGEAVEVRVTRQPKVIFAARDRHFDQVPLFIAATTAERFARVLIRELDRISKTYGLAEYRALWQREDFPSEKLIELRQALSDWRKGKRRE